MAASSKRFQSHTAAAGAAGASARNSHAVGDSSQNKRAYIEAHGNDIFEGALAEPTRRVSFNDDMNAYGRMSPVGLCGCTRNLAISGSSTSRSATTGILKIRKPLSPGGKANAPLAVLFPLFQAGISIAYVYMWTALRIVHLPNLEVDKIVFFLCCIAKFCFQ